MTTTWNGTSIPDPEGWEDREVYVGAERVMSDGTYAWDYRTRKRRLSVTWTNITSAQRLSLRNQLTNLVDNGDTENTDTTNWSTWTRSELGSAAADGSYAWSSTNSAAGKVCNNYIPVDTDKTYIGGASIKTGLADTRVYAGLALYNSNSALLGVHNCFREASASYDTTLYEAVSSGATSCKIVPPSSDWALLSAPYIQFEVETDYADQPNMTSRRIATSSGIDKANDPTYWTVNLYSGQTVPDNYDADTAVGVSRGGNTYLYYGGTYTTSGTSWGEITQTINGTNDPYTQPSYDEFWIGTAYVRPLFIVNYNQADTTYVDIVYFYDTDQYSGHLALPDGYTYQCTPVPGSYTQRTVGGASSLWDVQIEFIVDAVT